ncbi:hypothetical protein BEWA_047200 [Theileria equi strain WA]|uniref:Signal peptide containing protein n=1 Tax=Theileria equi strain WA TaxID=1537102 RepID=L1LAH0_THEEQ|nr:hypothetical protein BEWA_047200 [Theileria equi strain WA]EKX72255.1 hypothetical protein BEWA_047200 [Theileria equi strain WA]|eukprot:XP_004831707.1 hypothetical protein BEWA_047200 [Theileria equi strain WA]
MEIVKQINETKHFIIEQIDEGVALCNDDVHGFLKRHILGSSVSNTGTFPIKTDFDMKRFVHCLFFLLPLCHCGSVGRESLSTANDVNGQPEGPVIVRVEEDFTPYQRIPVTMDLTNPDSKLFEIEGEMQSEYPISVTPWREYYVTRVIYSGGTLWRSQDDWECTHVYAYSRANDTLLMMGFKRARRREYRALHRDKGGEWKEISMMAAYHLIFCTEKEGSENVTSV